MLARLLKIIMFTALGLGFLLSTLAAQKVSKIEVLSTHLVKEVESSNQKWEVKGKNMGFILLIEISFTSKTSFPSDDFYLEYTTSSRKEGRSDCFGINGNTADKIEGNPDKIKGEFWLFRHLLSSKMNFNTPIGVNEGTMKVYILFAVPIDTQEALLCYRQPVLKSKPIAIKRD